LHIDVDNDLLDLSNSGRPFNDLTAARVRNKRKYFISLIVCILNWFEINFKFIYRYKCDDAYEGAILFYFCFSLNFFLKNRLLIAINFDDESPPTSSSAHHKISIFSQLCVHFYNGKFFFKKKSNLKWHWWCIKYLFLCMIRRKKSVVLYFLPAGIVKWNKIAFFRCPNEWASRKTTYTYTKLGM